MEFLIFKTFLIVFSALATFLSIVFMASPALFRRIEEFLGLEFGGSRDFATVIEGKINFFNDWVYKNKNIFGPLLALIAAMNTRNAFFL